MLEIVNALEVEMVGVFKDINSARRFNKKVGNTLKLYPVRTTHSYEQFIRKAFLLGSDGDFLESCVGEGNVHTRILKTPFRAVRCHVGSFSERDELLRRSFTRGEDRFNGNYKTSSLLAREEVLKLASNPFKVVIVQHYGIVNERNIDEFLRYFDQACKHLIEIEETVYVTN